jgi:hypothetical protein
MEKHRGGAEESLGTWKRSSRMREKSFVRFLNQIVYKVARTRRTRCGEHAGLLRGVKKYVQYFSLNT